MAGDQSECRRLRRLLFAFLWRELKAYANRDPRELQAIRLAKRALPERYRKALPRMNS